MRFSQRIGKKPVKTLLQVESIDEDLQNSLWNAILENFLDKLSDYSSYSETEKGNVCKLIWKDFFKKPIDKLPLYSNVSIINIPWFIEFLRDWFYKVQWYEIYDFIEFLADISDYYPQIDFIVYCNLILEHEVAGYRIINRKIVQITSEEETREIETVLISTEKNKSVNQHLKTALDMLSDRKTPDYRNSIKESISAVEALCVIITGNKSATLGKALSEIEKKYNLHPALKNAFSSIYGWTSDTGGIRHSLFEDAVEVKFEDAKFMLVSCSAFINYLKAKMKI